MAQLVFDIRVPINIVRKADNLYVASCRLLDVFSQGETLEQAKKNIAEALELFFTTCYEMGTIEAVLKKCGFRLVNSQAGPPSQDNDLENDLEMVNVPLPFVHYGPDSPHTCHA